MKSIRKPIVIVGAGFSGISAALSLKKFDLCNPIIIIDPKSSFVFKPLMYEVLSDEMKYWEVLPNFETIFVNSGITFLRNELVEINLNNHRLKFKDELNIEYQYLVLCTGSSANSYNIKGVDEFCYFFNDAEDLKKLKCFLEKETKSINKENIFVVGAGPSGVELACKLSDLYGDNFKIKIIEKSQEILINNKIFNREEAEKALKKKDIDILLSNAVEEIRKGEIYIKNSLDQVNVFKHHAVIWTAGIKPNLPIINQDTEKISGKLLINDFLQLKNHKNVFALGDISIIENKSDLPSTAQVAMQQGQHTANNINLLIRKKELLPFEFSDNGEMISLGVGEASISSFGITLSGKFAYEIRRLVYASKMPIFEKSFKSAASWLIDKKSVFFN